MTGTDEEIESECPKTVVVLVRPVVLNESHADVGEFVPDLCRSVVHTELEFDILANLSRVPFFEMSTFGDGFKLMGGDQWRSSGTGSRSEGFDSTTVPCSLPIVSGLDVDSQQVGRLNDRQSFVTVSDELETAGHCSVRFGASGSEAVYLTLDSIERDGLVNQNRLPSCHFIQSD